MNILKTSDYSKLAYIALHKYGDLEIQQISVGRVELSKFTIGLLNIVSQNEFNRRLKETNQDKLFHLFLILKTSKGDILVEKNDVITITKKRIPPKTDILIVPNSKGFNLIDMLEKTRALMGSSYFLYSGKDNNCQYFVQSILKSNGLLNNDINAYVMQQTRDLFQNKNFRKITNTVTDIAALKSRYDDLGNPIMGVPIAVGNHLYQKVFSQYGK